MSNNKNNNEPQQPIFNWAEGVNIVEPARFEFLFTDRALTANQQKIVAAAQWPDDFNPQDLQSLDCHFQDGEFQAELAAVIDAVKDKDSVHQAILNRFQLVAEILLQLNVYLGERCIEEFFRIELTADQAAMAAFASAEGKSLFKKLAQELDSIEVQEAEQLIEMALGGPEPAQILEAAVAAPSRADEVIKQLWSKLERERGDL